MNKELDDLLCQRYPEIFKDRNGGIFETSMNWGFCCGDGWFDIIDGLCADITACVAVGSAASVIASQVKSKSGFLRFHFKDEFGGSGYAPIRNLIRMAQQWSEHTCEECGRLDVVWHSGAVCASCDARR